VYGFDAWRFAVLFQSWSCAASLRLPCICCVNLAAAVGVMQKGFGLSNVALGLAFSAFNYAYDED
jgi:hypothetical protein